MAEEMGFCKLLNELIKDEEQAPKQYEKLQDEVNVSLEYPSEEKPVVFTIGSLTMAIIESIKKDERKHKELLEVLKDLFCEGE